jgi:hypothetical protein
LSRALDDHDEAVRRGAVDALIVIARVSPEAWPVLIGALGNTHDDVPHRIEETIEANGNQAFAVKIVPLLQRNLHDPNPKVRGASAVTLSTILAANGASYGNSYADDLAKMRPLWTDWKGPPPGDLILDIAKNLKNVDRDKLTNTIQVSAIWDRPPKSRFLTCCRCCGIRTVRHDFSYSSICGLWGRLPVRLLPMQCGSSRIPTRAYALRLWQF